MASVISLSASTSNNQDIFRMNNNINNNNSNPEDWISTAHIPLDLTQPSTSATQSHQDATFKRPLLDPNRRKSNHDQSNPSKQLDQSRKDNEGEDEEDEDEEEIEELDDEDESESEEDSSPREDEPASSPLNLDQLDVYALAGFGLNASNRNHRSTNPSTSKSRSSNNNNQSIDASSSVGGLATTPVNGIGMVPSPSASTPGNNVMTPNTTKDYVGSAIQLLTHFLGSSNPNSSASDDNQAHGSSNANTPRGQNGQNGTQDLLPLINSIIARLSGQLPPHIHQSEQPSEQELTDLLQTLMAQQSQQQAAAAQASSNRQGGKATMGSTSNHSAPFTVGDNGPSFSFSGPGDSTGFTPAYQPQDVDLTSTSAANISSNTNNSNNPLNLSDPTWFAFLNHTFPNEDEEDDPDFMPEAGDLPEAWNQALQQHFGDGSNQTSTQISGGNGNGNSTPSLGFGTGTSPRLRESPRRAAKQAQQLNSRAMSPLSALFGNVRNMEASNQNQSTSSVGNGSGSLNFGQLLSGKQAGNPSSQTQNQNQSTSISQLNSTNQTSNSDFNLEGLGNENHSKTNDTSTVAQGKARASDRQAEDSLPPLAGKPSRSRDKKSKDRKEAPKMSKEEKKEREREAAKIRQQRAREKKVEEKRQKRIQEAVDEAIANGEDPETAAREAGKARGKGRPTIAEVKTRERRSKYSNNNKRNRGDGSDLEDRSREQDQDQDDNGGGGSRSRSSRKSKKARTSRDGEEDELSFRASSKPSPMDLSRDQTPISNSNLLNGQEFQELISLRAEVKLLREENSRLQSQNEELKVDARIRDIQNGKGTEGGSRSKSISGSIQRSSDRKNNGEGSSKKKPSRDDGRDRNGQYRKDGSRSQINSNRKDRLPSRRREASVDSYDSNEEEDFDNSRRSNNNNSKVKSSRRQNQQQPLKKNRSPSISEDELDPSDDDDDDVGSDRQSFERRGGRKGDLYDRNRSGSEEDDDDSRSELESESGQDQDEEMRDVDHHHHRNSHLESPSDSRYERTIRGGGGDGKSRRKGNR